MPRSNTNELASERKAACNSHDLVASVALEYRVGDRLHGIEFMTLDASGLVSFAAGNDVLPPEQLL